jgi:hypothetical protein
MFGGKSAPSGVSPGDYAKYLAAGIFLRAWGEGLAQYAEFDVSAGSAQSQTFATHVVWTLYCLGDAARQDMQKAANQLLATARTTPEMVDRKANALRQPFTSRNGGYLPGYLAVKRVASRLRAAGGVFEDTDFVFSYLKAFVFNDPITVQMSLTMDGMAFSGQYFEHLSRRFAELLERSDEELRQAGDAMDKFMASRSGVTNDPLEAVEAQFFPGLFVSQSDYASAHLLLIQRLQHLGVFKDLARSATDGPENVIEQFYRAIANQRYLFCLSSSDIAASDVLAGRLISGEAVVLVRTPDRNTYFLSQWNQDRYVEIRGITPFELDPASRTPVDLPGLRLEVWLDPVRTKAFVCLHSGEAKRVGIQSLLGRCEWPDLPNIMPRDDAAHLIEIFDRSLRESPIGSGSGPATSLDQATGILKERVFKATDTLLSRLAFPGPNAEQIAGMLAAKGLGGLPSYHPDALRGLALMSLADSSGQPVEAALGSSGLPPSCLDLANALIADMENLGWSARSGAVWSV